MPRADERTLATLEVLRRSGGEIESTVRGNSMGQTLPAGTRIRIACGPCADLADGAAIAVVAGDAMIGHRLVGRCRDRRGREALLIRGDATLICDPPIDPALIVGQITCRQAGAGWQPVPPAPYRGPWGAFLAAAILGCVRAFARLDVPQTAVAHEHLLTLMLRVRRKLSGLQKHNG